MSGGIRIDSEPGVGTIALCSLPLEVATERAPAPPATAHSLPQRALHLLLVEDELVNRLAVGALLRRDGHTVLEAASGRQALDMSWSTMPASPVTACLSAWIPGRS